MVRAIPQTEAPLFFPAGLIRRTERPEVLAIRSTVSPRDVLELCGRRPKQTAQVKAPISGAAVAAQERRLNFVLGGDAPALDRIEPVPRTRWARGCIGWTGWAAA